MLKTLKYIHSIFSQPGGRIGRRAFILGLCFWIVLIPTAATLPVYLIHQFFGYTMETFGNADLFFKLAVLGGYLVFFYFSIYGFFSIHIKRLHDINHLGWWLLAFPIYPVLLFFLVIKEGNPKENNYGEPRKD